MKGRLAWLVVGALLIVAIRFLLSPHQPLESEKSWQKRSWNNLYTTIHLTAQASPESIDSAIAAIDTFFTRFTNDYKEGGRLDQKILSASAGDTLLLTPEEWSIVRFSEEAWKKSRGAIHPGIGTLLQLWGLVEGHSPARPSDSLLKTEVANLEQLFFELDSARKTMIIRRAGVKIALGSFLKGWAIDRAAEYLDQLGLENYLLEVGGDLRCAGNNPQGKNWKLGIRNPYRPNELIATVLLGGELPCAMASSGGYARFWTDSSTGEHHHHILNPLTGMSARGMEGNSVIAATAVEADLIATWLFVVGPEEAKRVLSTQLPEVDALLIPAEGEPWATPRLHHQLHFTAN